MKVLFSGGGTLGPVTPLLAFLETIKNKKNGGDFVWVGTKNGSERRLLEEFDIPYFSIAESKLRRYVSWLLFKDIYNFFVALIQAFRILKREKPDVCISAGAYVSVPIHIIAKILGIPTWVHQQDVEVGLSNRIMGRFANLVTVTLDENKKDFRAKQVVVLGNPIRKFIFEGDRDRVIRKFSFDPSKPIILATGGGTGAEKLNELVVECVKRMGDQYQWIHLTGETRKRIDSLSEFSQYKAIPFVTDEMKDFYAAADLVISRGGFGTLCELASLQKTVLVIPKPGHQEKNVAYFESRSALVSFHQDDSVEKLSSLIEKTLKLSFTQELSSQFHKLLVAAKDEDIIKLFDQFQK